jgi:hypothetical protein
MSKPDQHSEDLQRLLRGLDRCRPCNGSGETRILGILGECPNCGGRGEVTPRDPGDGVTECEYLDCDDEGYEWEIVEGLWCCDHAPQPDNVPQEWSIDPE